jgi:hypothetical protein
MDVSPNVITCVIMEELSSHYFKICKAIHEYSFNAFAHHITKHYQRFLETRKHIEQDQTHFTHNHRSMLSVFLGHVDLISEYVKEVMSTKCLSTTFMEALQGWYWHWTEHNLLPKDLPDNEEISTRSL